MLDYTIFGESHGPAVGVLVTGAAPGLPVDREIIARELERRAPGGPLATARHEPDRLHILSGVYQGFTTGDPICLVLENRDARSGDYEALRNKPRPGHADYAAWVRSGGHNDPRGGGAYSGRLTAPLVAAGAMVNAWLKEQDIELKAQVIDENALRQQAAEAKADGDSVGGEIACTVTGLPAGLGGPGWREAVESELARHLFAIPAVKALGFGDGAALAHMRGSRANDPLRTDGTRIRTVTNHNGGINGGVTNGMPLTFTVTFKPTPSIALPQDTVDLSRMENCTVAITGRHDPCIALRAAPIVEAAAALALWRVLNPRGGGLDTLRLQLDDVDRQLVGLLVRRQELSRDIGAYKAAHGLPVRDPEREAQVLRSRGDLAPEHRAEVERLYETLMALSREEPDFCGPARQRQEHRGAAVRQGPEPALCGRGQVPGAEGGPFRRRYLRIKRRGIFPGPGVPGSGGAVPPGGHRPGHRRRRGAAAGEPEAAAGRGPGHLPGPVPLGHPPHPAAAGPSPADG